MKDNDSADDNDNSIEVNVSDGIDVPDGDDGEIPSIPDQLRALADMMDEDDDEKIIVGIAGVDMRRDENGARPTSYNFHMVDGAIDDLSADETLGVIDILNQRLVENAFNIGLRDALDSSPFDDMQVVGGGAVDLSDIFGGGR